MWPSIKYVFFVKMSNFKFLSGSNFQIYAVETRKKMNRAYNSWNVWLLNQFRAHSLKLQGKLLPEGSREPSIEDRIHAGITVCKNMGCNLQQNKVLVNSRFRDRVQWMWRGIKLHSQGSNLNYRFKSFQTLLLCIDGSNLSLQ